MILSVTGEPSFFLSILFLFFLTYTLRKDGDNRVLPLVRKMYREYGENYQKTQHAKAYFYLICRIFEKSDNWHVTRCCPKRMQCDHRHEKKFAKSREKKENETATQYQCTIRNRDCGADFKHEYWYEPAALHSHLCCSYFMNDSMISVAHPETPTQAFSYSLHTVSVVYHFSRTDITTILLITLQ